MRNSNTAYSVERVCKSFRCRPAFGPHRGHLQAGTTNALNGCMTTTETQNQVQWLAFDRAYAACEGTHNEKMVAGYKARNAVIARALKEGVVEGPAEHPTSFSMRSTLVSQS